MSNQLQRVAVAAVGIPLAGGAVWYGGLVLVALVALIAALGTRELYGLAERAGVRPLKRLGITLAVLVPIVTWVVAAPVTDAVTPLGSFVAGLLGPLWLWVQWPLVMILVPVLVLTLVLIRRRSEQRPLAAAAITLFGPIYCALLPSAVLLIRFGAGGERSFPAMWLVFFPLAVTWLCDSF
ncbi:MAG TPA: phosphatidate cytidylyltransferase, partial [Gemmatimonadales bacterium]|nr:phosphatidate cytidylyltransferase [Gemmatimonadales bacterium]